jgi:hypothetical protein
MKVALSVIFGQEIKHMTRNSAGILLTGRALDRTETMEFRVDTKGTLCTVCRCVNLPRGVRFVDSNQNCSVVLKIQCN